MATEDDAARAMLRLLPDGGIGHLYDLCKYWQACEYDKAHGDVEGFLARRTEFDVGSDGLVRKAGSEDVAARLAHVDTEAWKEELYRSTRQLSTATSDSAAGDVYVHYVDAVAPPSDPMHAASAAGSTHYPPASPCVTAAAIPAYAVPRVSPRARVDLFGRLSPPCPPAGSSLVPAVPHVVSPTPTPQHLSTTPAASTRSVSSLRQPAPPPRPTPAPAPYPLAGSTVPLSPTPPAETAALRPASSLLPQVRHAADAGLAHKARLCPVAAGDSVAPLSTLRHPAPLPPPPPPPAHEPPMPLSAATAPRAAWRSPAPPPATAMLAHEPAPAAPVHTLWPQASAPAAAAADVPLPPAAADLWGACGAAVQPPEASALPPLVEMSPLRGDALLAAAESGAPPPPPPPPCPPAAALDPLHLPGDVLCGMQRAEARLASIRSEVLEGAAAVKLAAAAPAPAAGSVGVDAPAGGAALPESRGPEGVPAGLSAYLDTLCESHSFRSVAQALETWLGTYAGRAATGGSADALPTVTGAPPPARTYLPPAPAPHAGIVNAAASPRSGIPRTYGALGACSVPTAAGVGVEPTTPHKLPQSRHVSPALRDAPPVDVTGVRTDGYPVQGVEGRVDGLLRGAAGGPFHALAPSAPHAGHNPLGVECDTRSPRALPPRTVSFGGTHVAGALGADAFESVMLPYTPGAGYAGALAYLRQMAAVGATAGTLLKYTPHDLPGDAVDHLASMGVRARASSVRSGMSTDDILRLAPRVFSTDNLPGSWVEVSLALAKIIPTHYTLAYTPPPHTRAHPEHFLCEKPLSWHLEASADGVRYDTLSTHVADTAFGPPGEPSDVVVSFKIDDAQMYHQYFRIVQTDANAAGSHHLCISGFEVYGLLKLQM